jgi:charged multivesicular body protein 1
MERSFQVRMQAKQLESEARRLLKDANKERQRAKTELSRGNRAAAALYAQNAVRYEQQANQLLQNASAVNGMALDMKAAQTTAQTAKTMGVATGAMAQATAHVDLTKLSKNRTRMDGLKQQMGAAHEMLTGGEGETQLQAGAEDLLAALEEENNALAMMALADIPEGIPGQAAPANPPARYTAH